MRDNYESEQAIQDQAIEVLSTDIDLMSDTAKQDSKNHHHHRKRRKHYYNSIRKQMEFYFSDSNLTKDRFLKQLVSADPYVPLTVFMNFNRIKEMARSVEDIEKALENSDILELSCDKQQVRRITEIHEKNNVDEYTIYVEALPTNATHDSVRNQFKQFGAIAYVSLPKYSVSGRIKEFSFIEFEHKSSVEKCIEYFRNLDAVIDNNFNPEKMQSVISFKNEQDEFGTFKGTGSASDPAVETKTKETTENENKEKKPAHHRHMKRALIEEDDDNLEEDISDADSLPSNTSQPLPSKRLKLSDDPTEYGNNATENSEKENDTNADGTDDGDQDSDEEECDPNNLLSTKRKRRKRRKVKTVDIDYQPPLEQFSNYQNADAKSDADSSISMLRVATKVEWKRLRNKYLNLQRQQYALFKKQTINNKKQVKGNNQKKSTLPPLPVIMKNRQQMPQTSHNQKSYSNPMHSITFYGANKEDATNANSNEEEVLKSAQAAENNEITEATTSKVASYEYEPGLIVKINFDKPCVNVPDFKAEMKQYAFVRYVDLKEGQTSAYIRVDAPRSAPILIKFCAPHRCQILTGDNETEYWQKIKRDREEKLSKSVRVRRTRNRLPLSFKTIECNKPVKSNVHIRFED